MTTPEAYDGVESPAETRAQREEGPEAGRQDMMGPHGARRDTTRLPCHSNLTWHSYGFVQYMYQYHSVHDMPVASHCRCGVSPVLALVAVIVLLALLVEGPVGRAASCRQLQEPKAGKDGESCRTHVCIGSVTVAARAKVGTERGTSSEIHQHAPIVCRGVGDLAP